MNPEGVRGTWYRNWLLYSAYVFKGDMLVSCSLRGFSAKCVITGELEVVCDWLERKAAFNWCIVDCRETLLFSVPVIIFLNVQSILRLSGNGTQRAGSPVQEFHLIGFKGIPKARAYIMVSKKGNEVGAGCGWESGVCDVWWERKGRCRGEDLALNIPRLVCQQLGFMVPLQRGGRHGSELAVESGLLVSQHHLVLRSDHWPRKTLIC